MSTTPNGQGPRLPIMNPQERMVWLASHRAAPYYRLITVAEMAILEGQIRRAMVYESEFKEIVKILDAHGYWQDRPDVRTAVSDAVVDARRFQIGMMKAIEDIIKYLESNTGDPERFEALRPTLSFLRAQNQAVREPSKPSP